MKRIIYISVLIHGCRSDFRAESSASETEDGEAGTSYGEGTSNDVTDAGTDGTEEGEGTENDSDGSTSASEDTDSTGIGDSDSSTSAGEGDSGSDSGVMPDMPPPDDPEYPACDEPEDCPDFPDQTCLLGAEHCAISCWPPGAEECPIPDTGNAIPQCLDALKFCTLSCAGGLTCPNGMDCEDTWYNTDHYGFICTRP